MPSHKKNDLRKTLKSSIKNINTQEKLEKEKLIQANLIKILKELGSLSESIVGVYAPLFDEVDWTPLLKEIENLNTAFPASLSNIEFSMEFYKCHFGELEENNGFGVTILSPPTTCQKVIPDILLIPGLGFHSDGRRLGRGKGYYDRYLEKFTGHRVGICFEEQLTNEIPADEYDQNVHILVTDKEIYRCSLG